VRLSSLSSCRRTRPKGMSLELPADLGKAIQNALRPGPDPTLLWLEFSEDGRERHSPISVSSEATTTLPDEMDVASLLWRTQMAMERDHKFTSDTTVLRLTVPDIFEALWTAWRTQDLAGISYQLRLADNTVFSGQRTLKDRERPLAEWDGRLAPFGKLPADRLAGRKAMASLPPNAVATLQINFTGSKSLDFFDYSNVRFFVQKPI